MKRKKTVTVSCGLCGAPIAVDPSMIPEERKDVNFFCLLCGFQVEEAMQAGKLPGSITLHHPDEAAAQE